MDLLVAQAMGYRLRDTSPFRQLSISEEPLAEGRVDGNYTHSIAAGGGVPAYFWEIESGALPEGLSLDSFTGTISGIPLESGNFAFVVRVRDSTEGNSGITSTVNLKVTD